MFVPERFQGGFRAQVLTLPILPVGRTSGHVSLHVEVEDIAAEGVGCVELLLVAQGVSLVQEKIQKVREAGVILVKKLRFIVHVSGV